MQGRGKHLMEMLDSFHDRGLLRVNTGVDLYIRDDVGDPGVDLYTGPVFWNSPDLWIRNTDDGGTAHQNPEFGQDNWLPMLAFATGTAPLRGRSSSPSTSNRGRRGSVHLSK